jgi:hypothetical protein
MYDPSGLYNGVFAMADRQTGSVWTHYDGSVLTGPLAGNDVQLGHVPLVHTTWAEWRAERPESLVLDQYDEYRSQYARSSGLSIGDSWFGQSFRDSLLHEDDRLDRTEIILGAGIESEMRAYVLADLPSELSVLHDELAGYPIVVFTEPSSLYGLAFSSTVDGKVLEFGVDDGRIIDTAGTTWDRSGLGTDGPLSGTQLQHVTSFVSEWYGWVAFYPDTTIYEA